MDAIADTDGDIRDSNWRNGGNVLDFGNCLGIFEGEVGFNVLIISSEFIDNVISDGFARRRTDENEISIIFRRIGTDEAINSAGQRKNKHNGGDADGNTESGKESAATVLTEAIDSEMEMSV